MNGQRLQIVTASDTKFYSHLRNLLLSLRHQSDQAFDLCVLDVGLTSAEAADLRSEGVEVKVADQGVFGSPDPAIAHLEIRPCLPMLFPEAEWILWLDADIWLQRPDFLERIRQLLERDEFLVSPQLHVAYGANCLDAKPRIDRTGALQLAGFNYDLTNKVFGPSYAVQLAGRATLNGGMFGGHRGSALWSEWQSTYRLGFAERRTFGIDQVTLISATANTRAKFGFIPPRMNWLCHFCPPAYDPERRSFVEPTAFFEELYALHLTAFTKSKPCKIPLTTGESLSVALFDPAVVKAALERLPFAPRDGGAHVVPRLNPWPRLESSPHQQPAPADSANKPKPPGLRLRTFAKLAKRVRYAVTGIKKSARASTASPERTLAERAVLMVHLGRCGSKVLTDLLCQDRRVSWDGEIFEQILAQERKVRGPQFKLHLDSAMIVADRVSSNVGMQLHGVEVKPYHLTYFSASFSDFIARLKDRGFSKFIVLDRRNKLRKIVSSLLAQAGGRWHLRLEQAKLNKVVVPVSRLLMDSKEGRLREVIRQFDDEFDRVRSILPASDALHLTYESDIMADPLNAYMKTVQYLGRPPLPVTVRMNRVNPFPLSDIILNYAEVAGELRGTPYEWMLEEKV